MDMLAFFFNVVYNNLKYVYLRSSLCLPKNISSVCFRTDLYC